MGQDDMLEVTFGIAAVNLKSSESFLGKLGCTYIRLILLLGDLEKRECIVVVEQVSTMGILDTPQNSH